MGDMKAVTLYRSQVMHRRFKPLQYRFNYRIFNLLIDIDRLGEVDQAHSWLSVGRFNLLSFYPADHLIEPQRNLRQWCNEVLQQQGVAAAHKVYLFCMPRVLGRVFNPLSLWFCEDRQGRPLGVIAEVRNTFGERHCYWLAAEAGQQQWPLRQSHAKQFYVSPFIEVSGEYQFDLQRPEQKFRLRIEHCEQQQPQMLATQFGQQLPLNHWNVLSQLGLMPLLSLKVLGAIHWQALKIWLRRTPLIPKPSPPTKEVS